jgi:DNA-binding GntR family transcriptional regulator
VYAAWWTFPGFVGTRRLVSTALELEALGHLRACLATATEKLARRWLKEVRENTRRFDRWIALATKNAFLMSMLTTSEDRIRLLGAMMAKYQGAHLEQSLYQNYGLLAVLESGGAEALFRR